MVNTTQFYKTKVALAVVLSLGLAACGDTEGDAGSTSTSTSTTEVEATQGAVETETNLTGTVQGVVVDSNGNPLEGVAVYLGSAETTTNAGGQYTFSDVAVTNVSGVNNEGDETEDDTTSTLIITIAGTDAYLGALVSVTPEAQVNNTGGTGAQTGENSDTTIQTFIDGFTAQAGTATLPLLNAGAYGYIRDCRTGQALASTDDLLSLDFTATTDDLNAGTGTELTNSENTATIGSDENGEFSLSNLAANSAYVITAKEGWEITAGTTTVTTASEGSSDFLGTIEVCPVSFTDNDLTPGAPYIASVAGSIGSTTGAGATNYEYEVLSKGIDGTDGITLNFSEAISADDVELSDIVVTLAANTDDTVQTVAEVASATLADDGMSLTVVLVEALGDEQRFSVWFPQHQYVDNKSNEIVTGDDYSVAGALTAPDTTEDDLVIDILAGDGAGSTEFGIASDVFSQETGKIGYIRTRLCTYIAPPETPEGLEAEQLVKTLDSSLLAVSPSWDNKGSGSDVTNLNGQENAVAGRDTGERLAERFGDTFTNDTAVIVGSVDNATGVTATAGTVTFSATSGEFEVVVPTTSHGKKVTLTPTGAFGVSGTPVTVTLEDKVAPTTILQENYELWAIEADYSSTTASSGTGATGSGGEVAEGSVSGDEGDPIIYIQPRHLTPTASNNIADRYEEFDAFKFDTELDDGAQTNPLYSGPGFAGWSDRGNSLGVAFSETIATGATSPLHSASVALALTGVLNGLTTDVDGNLIVGTVDTAGNNVIPKSGSDLARFTVADMIAFANNDHNEAVDFTNGSIVDARGNLANANSDARVVIRDAMPPFVTAGRWDGSNLIITFNETIVPENNDDLILTDLDAANTLAAPYTLTLSSTATFPTEGAYTLSVAGDELTVAIDAASVSGLFQNGPNDEYEFDSDGDSIVENHLALNFDDIQDARGNSWATFDRDENSALTVDSNNDTNADRVGRYLVDAPRFMVYNDVGIFTITKQTLGYSDAGVDGDDDGEVTLRFTFSHPIDLDGTAIGLALDAAAVPGPSYTGPALTLAEANALFQIDLDGPGVGAAANMADAGGNFNAFFSSDYTTITIQLDEGANNIDALVTQLIFQDTVESAITDEALANETYTVVNSN